MKNFEVFAVYRTITILYGHFTSATPIITIIVLCGIHISNVEKSSKCSLIVGHEVLAGFHHRVIRLESGIRR
uniref:Uncharacterized protein MANES_13G060100 n=1 Tax=Rhizophora mucronata TaxID=61149 RepID=A0A2P2Q647_RHIMU